MNSVNPGGTNPLKPEGASHGVFARHETFHPRFGWIKKGFDAAKSSDDVLSYEDSHIRLGVGKNMAQSIKYWCTAFKVVQVTQSPDGRGRTHVPTDFGRRLLSDDGWDPWVEDPASLWLLHWNLLKEPCHATAWYFAFNEFRRTEFSVDDLLLELRRFRDGLGSRASDSSLNKDLTCILRMYAEQPRKKRISEETLDCPFVDLGLVQNVGDVRHYAFRLGAKPNLPAAAVVAACLEYVAAKDLNQRSVSISNLTYGKGSPGLAFKLTESALCTAIDEINEDQGLVSVTDQAGLMLMSFEERPDHLARRILDSYYTR